MRKILCRSFMCGPWQENVCHVFIYFWGEHEPIFFSEIVLCYLKKILIDWVSKNSKLTFLICQTKSMQRKVCFLNDRIISFLVLSLFSKEVWQRLNFALNSIICRLREYGSMVLCDSLLFNFEKTLHAKNSLYLNNKIANHSSRSLSWCRVVTNDKLRI